MVENAWSGAVASDTLGVALAEQLEDFAGVGVTAGPLLGVEQLTVDDDVVDARTTGDEFEPFDDVLIVREEVVDRAHGAGRIVSRNAVFDGDDVFRVAHEAEATDGSRWLAQPCETADASAAVADAGRDGVDRQLDPTLDELGIVVVDTVPEPAEEVDLHHVERVEIRIPVPE